MWRLRLKALLNVLKPPQGTEGRPVRECTYYFFPSTVEFRETASINYTHTCLEQTLAPSRYSQAGCSRHRGTIYVGKLFF